MIKLVYVFMGLSSTAVMGVFVLLTLTQNHSYPFSFLFVSILITCNVVGWAQFGRGL